MKYNALPTKNPPALWNWLNHLSQVEGLLVLQPETTAESSLSGAHSRLPAF